MHVRVSSGFPEMSKRIQNILVYFCKEPVFVCTETFTRAAMEAHVPHTSTHTADEEMGTVDPCHGDSY